MNTAAPPNLQTHQRWLAEIISHGIWLYCCFCLRSRVDGPGAGRNARQQWLLG